MAGTLLVYYVLSHLLVYWKCLSQGLTVQEPHTSNSAMTSMNSPIYSGFLREASSAYSFGEEATCRIVFLLLLSHEKCPEELGNSKGQCLYWKLRPWQQLELWSLVPAPHMLAGAGTALAR